MFFSGSQVLRLIIQNEKVINSYPAFNTRKRGTLIIYMNNRVEIKTLHDLDPKGVKLAIQGFNCNYEADGVSKSLLESTRLEGWAENNDAIYNYNGLRPAIGYDYKTNELVIVVKSTNALGIRHSMLFLLHELFFAYPFSNQNKEYLRKALGILNNYILQTKIQKDLLKSLVHLLYRPYFSHP